MKPASNSRPPINRKTCKIPRKIPQTAVKPTSQICQNSNNDDATTVFDRKEQKLIEMTDKSNYSQSRPHSPSPEKQSTVIEPEDILNEFSEKELFSISEFSSSQSSERTYNILGNGTRQFGGEEEADRPISPKSRKPPPPLPPQSPLTTSLNSSSPVVSPLPFSEMSTTHQSPETTESKKIDYQNLRQPRPQKRLDDCNDFVLPPPGMDPASTSANCTEYFDRLSMEQDYILHQCEELPPELLEIPSNLSVKQQKAYFKYQYRLLAVYQEKQKEQLQLQQKHEKERLRLMLQQSEEQERFLCKQKRLIKRRQQTERLLQQEKQYFSNKQQRETPRTPYSRHTLMSPAAPPMSLQDLHHLHQQQRQKKYQLQQQQHCDKHNQEQQHYDKHHHKQQQQHHVQHNQEQRHYDKHHHKQEQQHHVQHNQKQQQQQQHHVQHNQEQQQKQQHHDQHNQEQQQHQQQHQQQIQNLQENQQQHRQHQKDFLVMHVKTVDVAPVQLKDTSDYESNSLKMDSRMNRLLQTIHENVLPPDTKTDTKISCSIPKIQNTDSENGKGTSESTEHPKKVDKRCEHHKVSIAEYRNIVIAKDNVEKEVYSKLSWAYRAIISLPSMEARKKNILQKSLAERSQKLIYPQFELITCPEELAKEMKFKRSQYLGHPSSKAPPVNIPRLPVVCPGSCHRPVFVSDFIKHIIQNHFCVQIQHIAPKECKGFYLDGKLARRRRLCAHMLYLLSDRSCNLGSGEYKDLLPIVVMSAQLSKNHILGLSQATPNNDMKKHSTRSGERTPSNDKHVYLMIWLMGIVPATYPNNATLAIWRNKSSSRGIPRRHICYSGPIRSLWASQRSVDIFRSGNMILLNSHELNLLTNHGRDKFQVQVQIH